jgi:6-phosphogluconolactonase
MKRRTFGQYMLGTAGALLAGQSVAVAAGSKLWVYFGPYTGGKSDSKGIYVSSFDPATGEFGTPELAVEAASPSFLELHPTGKYLYAVGESDGGVRAFSVEADGKLKLLNKVLSKGKGPCHVNVDKTGKVVVVAYYGSGSTASFQVKPDGSLSETVTFLQHEGEVADKKRQGGPHAHSANFSPDNRYVFVCDLGLDKVFIYKVDVETAALTPHGFGTVPPKSGPRHLAFSKSGKHVFVNNEISLTETSFAYDADKGTLTTLDTVSLLPKDVPFTTAYSTAETRVHPNGKWVYVSLRTHNTLTRLTLDEATGKLTFASNTSSGGKIPRNFNIDPSGRWLFAAHQDSGNVVLFEIDQTTGDLKPTGKEQHVAGCVCVRFLAQK